jgi:thymidine kinase
MTVFLLAQAEDLATGDIQRSEQAGCAVALVVMSHRLAAALFERQARLGAIQRLDLAFRGLPFGEMLDIAWLVRTYSGNLTELVAYCSCGAKAIYPQRLIDGKPAHYDSPIIMAGDFYEPRCAEHFVLPGRPH